jgi:hypothetical protein
MRQAAAEMATLWSDSGFSPQTALLNTPLVVITHSPFVISEATDLKRHEEALQNQNGA